jgi:hypothetical protein
MGAVSTAARLDEKRCANTEAVFAFVSVQVATRLAPSGARAT